MYTIIEMISVVKPFIAEINIEIDWKNKGIKCLFGNVIARGYSKTQSRNRSKKGVDKYIVLSFTE